MKKYPLIDVAKLYCAVLIVLIHALEIPEGHYLGNLFKSSLSSQAVPFFFIVSGFFFKKKWSITQDKKQFVKGYIKHLLMYYAIWVLISAPELFHQYVTKYSGSSFAYIAALIFRRIFFAGYGVFWYLLVTAEAALIIGFMLKKKKTKLLYVLAGVGLLLDMIYYTRTSLPGFQTINQIFYTIFSWNNNFIMKGLPHMVIGVYFADHCENWNFKANRLLIAYVAVFLVHVVTFVALFPVVDNPGRYTLLYPIQAVLLFLLAVSANQITLPEKLVRECRPLSSAIYCLHCFAIYYVINPTIGINANTFLRTAIAVVLPVAVYWIAKKAGFKPLVRLLTLK